MRKRKDGPCKKHDKYDYTIEDTRAYGLYTHNGNGKGRWVKIDPKKFQKENGVEFTEQQLQVINKRRTHYFQPSKDNYDDYYCNHFVERRSFLCRFTTYTLISKHKIFGYYDVVFLCILFD
jgi:hypothetical protein